MEIASHSLTHSWLPDLPDRELQREVTERMDHRHLNYEVPELAGQIPTCENIAAMIWRLLEPKITQGRLDRVRVYESPDLFAECTAELDGEGSGTRGPALRERA